MTWNSKTMLEMSDEDFEEWATHFTTNCFGMIEFMRIFRQAYKEQKP